MEPARAAVTTTAADAAVRRPAVEPIGAAVAKTADAAVVEPARAAVTTTTTDAAVVMAAGDKAADALAKRPETAAVLLLPDALRALASIFDDITAKDIRQRSGRTHGNAGELLPAGVADVLAAMGPLHECDAFLDIGAGIGNVLAQVALTTKVERCIGVEVRAELSSIATRRIRQDADTYPQLRKVELKPADVRDVLMSTQPPTSEATVIFANYFLFEEAAKLVVAS
jgi:hypothetical protein